MVVTTTISVLSLKHKPIKFISILNNQILHQGFVSQQHHQTKPISDLRSPTRTPNWRNHSDLRQPRSKRKTQVGNVKTLYVWSVSCVYGFDFLGLRNRYPCVSSFFFSFFFYKVTHVFLWRRKERKRMKKKEKKRPLEWVCEEERKKEKERRRKKKKKNAVEWVCEEERREKVRRRKK